MGIPLALNNWKIVKSFPWNIAPASVVVSPCPGTSFWVDSGLSDLVPVPVPLSLWSTTSVSALCAISLQNTHLNEADLRLHLFASHLYSLMRSNWRRRDELKGPVSRERAKRWPPVHELPKNWHRWKPCDRGKNFPSTRYNFSCHTFHFGFGTVVQILQARKCFHSCSVLAQPFAAPQLRQPQKRVYEDTITRWVRLHVG